MCTLSKNSISADLHSEMGERNVAGETRTQDAGFHYAENGTSTTQLRILVFLSSSDLLWLLFVGLFICRTSENNFWGMEGGDVLRAKSALYSAMYRNYYLHN